jgi:predicted pyridoxine 5'-phosphate oxidase superfamily flavin-nucleotide-binding protein
LKLLGRHEAREWRADFEVVHVEFCGAPRYFVNGSARARESASVVRTPFCATTLDEELH